MDNFKVRVMNLDAELKAPKNLYNSFGKYKYRNAEGILESVKPLLVKYNLILTMSDEIIQVGDRYYIKAICTLADTESDEKIIVSAMARESLDKKGMDDSQITGTASSYARKYALNGLFLLDDTKDADTDEYQNTVNNGTKTAPKNSKKTNDIPTQNSNLNELITEEEYNSLVDCISQYDACNDKPINQEQMRNYFKVESFMMLTKAQYLTFMSQLKKGIK